MNLGIFDKLCTYIINAITHLMFLDAYNRISTKSGTQFNFPHKESAATLFSFVIKLFINTKSAAAIISRLSIYNKVIVITNPTPAVAVAAATSSGAPGKFSWVVVLNSQASTIVFFLIGFPTRSSNSYSRKRTQ